MRIVAKIIFNIILFGMVSGCVSMQEMQNGVNEIDSFWGEVNQKIISSKGSKVYSQEVSKCMVAAKKTALQLGFSIIEESNNSLILRALTPKPFTKDEFRNIKNIEEPIMQAIAANHVGKFYSNFFFLDEDGRFYITAKVNLTMETEDKSSVRVSFRIDPKEEVKGFIYGHNPPPEAVRKGLEKWWDAFESNLFNNQLK